MKAIRGGQVVAESSKDDLIEIEGNWYFPPSSLKKEFFRRSETPYVCPWKGACQYFDVGKGDEWSKDAAWSYPNPRPSAIEIVKKDFTDYVAFGGDVKIEE